MTGRCRNVRKLSRERMRDKGIRMVYDDFEANISTGLMNELPTHIVERAL